MFTQPLMYKRIQQQEQVLNLYSKKLIEEGVVTKDEVQVHLMANYIFFLKMPVTGESLTYFS